jgi:hypothetical protein
MTCLAHFVEQRNLEMVEVAVRAGSLVFNGSPTPMRRCIKNGYLEGAQAILREYNL